MFITTSRQGPGEMIQNANWYRATPTIRAIRLACSYCLTYTDHVRSCEVKLWKLLISRISCTELLHLRNLTRWNPDFRWKPPLKDLFKEAKASSNSAETQKKSMSCAIGKHAQRAQHMSWRIFLSASGCMYIWKGCCLQIWTNTPTKGVSLFVPGRRWNALRTSCYQAKCWAPWWRRRHDGTRWYLEPTGKCASKSCKCRFDAKKGLVRVALIVCHCNLSSSRDGNVASDSSNLLIPIPNHVF